MKRFLFAGYRDWALRVYQFLIETFPEHEFLLVRTHKDLIGHIESEVGIDAIICVGWSWIIEKKIVDDYFIVGIHPSDLPDFAGGSPIQNQILNGVISTKNTLFKLTSVLDQGPIIKQIPLNLSDHISNIFDRIVLTSIVMLVEFVGKFPDEITYLEKGSSAKGTIKKRITPEASKITKEMLQTFSALELFNFIRCHEDPYPNAFYEDDTGKLLFKFCDFEKPE
jgi:methionyl-tRNA formyltransferase